MEQRFSAALKVWFRCGFSRLGTSRAEAQRTTAALCRPEGLLHPLLIYSLLKAGAPDVSFKLIQYRFPFIDLPV